MAGRPTQAQVQYQPASAPAAAVNHFATDKFRARPLRPVHGQFASCFPRALTDGYGIRNCGLGHGDHSA